jgi:hypothetical protein
VAPCSKLTLSAPSLLPLEAYPWASALDCESIQREAIGELQRAIGFGRGCRPPADPDTLLPLSGPAEHDYGPDLPRALELEFSGGADFAAKHVLAQRANSAASLRPETGGDLEAVFDKVGIHSRRELLVTFNASGHRNQPRQTNAGSGSGRTTTVSAIGMISSTGRSARDACFRIASGLTAW